MPKKKETVSKVEKPDVASEALALAKTNQVAIEEVRAEAKKAFQTLENALSLLKERNRLR